MKDETVSRRRVLLATTAAAASFMLSRAARADADADAGAGASADETEAALEEVSKARASLRTLVGPFTQERTIGLLATKVRSTGTLVLVRPDRLRWELAPPDDVVYWVGPDGLAYKSARSQGRMPAAEGKLAAALDDIRTLLGGDVTHLRARYDLRVVQRNADGVAFEGIPKPGAYDAKNRLDKIAFALDKERVRPTRATLVEGPRDKTEITFGRLERDVPVDPARVRPPF